LEELERRKKVEVETGVEWSGSARRRFAGGGDWGLRLMDEMAAALFPLGFSFRSFIESTKKETGLGPSARAPAARNSPPASRVTGRLRPSAPLLGFDPACALGRLCIVASPGRHDAAGVPCSPPPSGPKNQASPVPPLLVAVSVCTSHRNLDIVRAQFVGRSARRSCYAHAKCSTE
jgi:hypothetical protein